MRKSRKNNPMGSHSFARDRRMGAFLLSEIQKQKNRLC